MAFDKEKQPKYLVAARASLETRDGGRYGEYPLDQAAKDNGVGSKGVRWAAVVLANPDMEYLVRDIEEGRISVWEAHRECIVATTGDASKVPGLVGLYVISECDGDHYLKVGKGRIPKRFDDLQSGNPRRLRLWAFWWFDHKGQITTVERSIHKLGVPARPEGVNGSVERMRDESTMWRLKTVVFGCK